MPWEIHPPIHFHHLRMIHFYLQHHLVLIMKWISEEDFLNYSYNLLKFLYRCLENKNKNYERIIRCYDITVRLWICIFGASMINWFSRCFSSFKHDYTPLPPPSTRIYLIRVICTYIEKREEEKKICIWFVLFLLFYRVCFFLLYSVYFLFMYMIEQWCCHSLFIRNYFIVKKKNNKIKNTLCMHNIRYLNKYLIQIDLFSLRVKRWLNFTLYSYK